MMHNFLYCTQNRSVSNWIFPLHLTQKHQPRSQDAFPRPTSKAITAWSRYPKRVITREEVIYTPSSQNIFTGDALYLWTTVSCYDWFIDWLNWLRCTFYACFVFSWLSGVPFNMSRTSSAHLALSHVLGLASHSYLVLGMPPVLKLQDRVVVDD